MEKINDLKKNGFIDKQTRSIVIDFFTYNAHADVFVVLNLEAVFEANGMITTTIETFNVKRSYYAGKLGLFRLGIEFFFVMLLIFYSVMEVLEIKTDVKGKLSDQKSQEELEKRNKEAGILDKEKNEKREEERKNKEEGGAPKNKDMEDEMELDEAAAEKERAAAETEK